MKSFIAFSLLVAAVAALPVTSDSKDATILRYDNDNIGVEGYNYAVETSDGKAVQESGVLKNVGTENEAIEVRGQFSYVGVDGVTYNVNYIANELGFQPSGAHLPQA
ncbi:hypothetical protein K1T71_005832 [Dendrolimus kikuchii]|uniref:Uncharacterized protein n=1 Tax=Dendrolimus kikuchii TaxID=765133 RepID=A0ACC1D5C9_9NEOP|nr:hypothetical protein K1T71_005832 [Dendrolimus kikuchii]